MGELSSDKIEFLERINSSVPALITVYNINSGEYAFVSDSLENILGYKKEKFLVGGLRFSTSIVHPDDLPLILAQNVKALKEANKKKYRDLPQPPIPFEYRMRHKNKSWRWILSEGSVFSRDKKGRVEYVMNVSVDITDRKEKEIAERSRHDQAESEKNKYMQLQMHSISLRAKVSDILRLDLPLEQILQQCLEVIVENLPATFCRLWQVAEEENLLELTVSAGNYPPTNTIRRTLQIGEYAVGLIAERKIPYITNDIYQNNFFHIQNITWAKKNKLTSFAGYPLFIKNKLVGVLAIFTTFEIDEEVLGIISYIADILAQEIERRRIEDQLNESKERYLKFIEQSSEGIWRFELEQPMPINLSVDKQIDHFYKFAYLAECNDALAKMYGYKKAEEILGARLGDMLVRDNPDNTVYLSAFITSNYLLSAAESMELDRFGQKKYFLNSLSGLIENGHLLRAWGIQQDITERKKAEENVLSLSRQKDEFIAIASHELKTPITSLKAYTQILERKIGNGDESTKGMLKKMDAQINKITALIADLLDVSRIEAGKIQFNFSNFNLCELVSEIVEEMQRTTESHNLVFKGEKGIMINADNDRIGQVVINFISNAIKYSPKANKVVIHCRKNRKSVKVSVQDFGIGISKKEQEHIFDRFFRANQQSYPGLGLGLYISAEIINRHNGEIGVVSKKGKGSTFYFSLPLDKS